MLILNVGDYGDHQTFRNTKERMQHNNLGGFIISRPPAIKKIPKCGYLSWLFQSDIHAGSSHSDLDHVREELDWAREHNARVLINGDVLDGVYHGDKRYRPSCVKPELAQRDDTLDAELDLAFKLYSPYADLLDCIGIGNHEDSRVKYGHSDPGLRLCTRLTDHLRAARSRHVVAYGGYAGMVLYSLPFERKLNIAFHHGFGKSSALSGAMSQYKQMEYIEGCDIVWLGHLHARMSAQLYRLRPPASGYEPELREVRFIRTGAYIHSHAGQSPDSLAEHGRKHSYSADAGFSLHGRGGAKVLLHLTKTSQKLEVIQ